MARVLCVLYDDPVDGHPCRAAPSETRAPGSVTMIGKEPKLAVSAIRGPTI